MNIFKLFLLFILFFTLQAKEQKLEQISLQLQWKHQFEFAGFYAAQEKGFYKDVGLDVTFIEYDENTDIVEKVLYKNTEYGLSYSSIIADYLNGEPIVFLANFFKQSPLVLITQEYIKTPADLKAKKVMGVSDGIDNSTLLSMLNKFNVNLKDIVQVPTNFKIDAFINKKIDAMSAFTTNELFQLNKRGIKYKIFDPTVYGAEYYDVNLFTSQEELKKHPKRVKNFTNASIKGWKYALEHQEEIIELILKKYNSQFKTKEALYFEAKQIQQIILPNVHNIGSIDINRVQAIADNFMQIGFINLKNPKKLNNFVYKKDTNSLNLTQAELDFLTNHPKIILGTEKSWKPYIIVSDTGTISGYDADVLALINTISGANFVLEAGEWADMQSRAKSKEIDGLSTGAVHAERKEYLNFSDSYIDMKRILLTSIDNPKNIHSIGDLKGKTIAIHASNLIDEKLAQKFNQSKILRLKHLEDVISSVITGDADAMFGNGSTFYIANDIGIPYLVRVAILDDTLSLAFGVRKDWPEAISIINKSLRYIGKHKLLELKNRWFFVKSIVKNSKPILTIEERNYLKNKEKITMCINPDWMPFEAMHKDKYVGINSDFIKIIQKTIGIPIHIVKTENCSKSIEAAKERRCDIVSLVMPTLSRREFLNFLTPYIDAPLIIVGKSDKRSILDIHHIEKSKIAVVKDSVIANIIKNNYPNLELVEVANVQEGLQKVEDNEVFAFAGTSVSIEYYFQDGSYSEFKTIGHFDEKLSLGLAVRNDDSILNIILKKLIFNISLEEKQSIMKKWFSLKYEKNFDNTLFWKFLVFIAIIGLFLVYRQYDLRRTNRRLKQEIEKEFNISRDKDKIIFHQNKLSAMGEMIENIAHQWRQPLSQVNSAILVLDGLLSQKNIHDATIEEKLMEIESLTQYMSNTIDDFKDFFAQDKERELFNLKNIIDNSISIIFSALKYKHIKLSLHVNDEITLNNYPRELQQVILVILNNAKDILIARKIDNPEIILTTEADEHSINILIYDNAGGIDDANINKIFDPYFTTKHFSEGTGLGLYISKMLIHESLNGSLNVTNTQEGACFHISLNKVSL